MKGDYNEMLILTITEITIRDYLIGQNFGGQNFRHQVEISAVLSNEIFHRFLISPYNSQEMYVLT